MTEEVFLAGYKKPSAVSHALSLLLVIMLLKSSIFLPNNPSERTQMVKSFRVIVRFK